MKLVSKFIKVDHINHFSISQVHHTSAFSTKLQKCTLDKVSTPGGDGEWAVNERRDEA